MMDREGRTKAGREEGMEGRNGGKGKKKNEHENPEKGTCE